MSGYLERGEPVTLLVNAKNRRGEPELDRQLRTIQRPRLGPQNAMIQRKDRSIVIRPFRGLVRDQVKRSRKDQGLDPVVNDPRFLEDLAREIGGRL